QVVVAGSTGSGLFTTRGALRSQLSDAFVAKINSDASQFVYQTYLEAPTVVKSVNLDADGNAYVAGVASNADYVVLTNGGGTAILTPPLPFETPNGFQAGPKSSFCPLYRLSGTYIGTESCYNAGFLSVVNP